MPRRRSSRPEARSLHGTDPFQMTPTECSTPKANGFGADEGGYEANGTAPITAFTSTKSERVARIASGSRRNEELDQALLTWTRTCAVRSDPRYRPRMTEPAKPATGTSFGNGVSRLTRRS